MIGQGNTQHDDFESENLETNEIGIGETDPGTSFVSSIFSEGLLADPTKRRYIIFGGVTAAVLIIFGAVYYFLSGDDPTDMPVVDTPPAEQMPAPEAPPADGMLSEEGEEIAGGTPTPEELPAPEGGEMLDEILMPAAPAGAVSIISPASGQSRDYDQTMGAAVFSWEGEATYITFARNSGFQNPYLRLNVSGRNSFSFQHPLPGRWYWRLEDANSNPLSETGSFTVAQAVRRNLALSEPANGGSLSSGAAVSWVGDDKVAYYRLELATNSFATPNYRFSTVNTSVQIADVAAGSYKLRVGAFSEVTGRWEYIEPISVTVQ